MTVITPPASTPDTAVRHPGRDDRPGWIPPEIGDDWDPSPYAYQTEEDLMPAGIPHNLFIGWVRSLLEMVLQRKGLFFVSDIFVLYRDAFGRKQRFASDGLVAPLPQDLKIVYRHMTSYDLEVEVLPVCLMEMTSESSHQKDLHTMRNLAEWLGIPEYVVFDIVDPHGNTRPHGLIHLWRPDVLGRYQRIPPDDEGYVWLKSLNMRVKFVGEDPVLHDMETGEFVDFPLKKLAQETKARKAEAEARKAAESKAQQEVEARKAAESKAQQEAKARKAAETKAQQEAEARKAAEAKAQQEAEARKAEAEARKALEKRLRELEEKYGPA